MNFEWDEQKAEKNVKKHDVSFEEASTVFLDPFELTIPDPRYSMEEMRYLTLGYSVRQRLLLVVYTERSTNIRIISGRLATKRERQQYESRI